MTSVVGTYKTWLTEQLLEFGDDEVFISYILGILEGDEAPEEKREALDSILSEAITTSRQDLDSFVDNIISKWHEMHSNQMQDDKKLVLPKFDVNEQLAKILEAQTLQSTAVKGRELSEEEKRIKEQILAQYSQTAVTDDEIEEEECEEAPEKSKASGIEKNTNFQDVLQLQKEKREQARVDSAAKKQKDKEDREKQKQLREEKKEKRKTVKGERRR